MKKLILIFIAFNIFISCKVYEPPKDYNIEKERSYSMNFDDVWNKIVDWFANNNTPIKNMDKNSGFIATEYKLNVPNRELYVDCGVYGYAGPIARNFPIDGNLNVTVREKNNTVTVKVNFFFESKKAQETYLFTVSCVSTGVLEKELLDYIKK